MSNRLVALGIVTLWYIIAFGAAIVLGKMLLGVDVHPLMVVLLASILATAVVFWGSISVNNSSVYDPYWSVVPPIICFFYLWTIWDRSISLRAIIVLWLVSLWALRLTANWAVQWRGTFDEDFRYANFRQQFPGNYWLISFLGIHMFPTLVVYVGCLSFWPAITATAALGIIDIIAIITTIGGIVVEAVADFQLLQFKKQHQSRRGEYLKKGLWAYMRHPNYTGEILFWIGLFFFALSAQTNTWIYTIWGPIIMVLLFTVISVPMIDKRMLSRRPLYQAEIDARFALLPFPKPGQRPMQANATNNYEEMRDKTDQQPGSKEETYTVGDVSNLLIEDDRKEFSN